MACDSGRGYTASARSATSPAPPARQVRRAPPGGSGSSRLYGRTACCFYFAASRACTCRPRTQVSTGDAEAAVGAVRKTVPALRFRRAPPQRGTLAPALLSVARRSVPDRGGVERAVTTRKTARSYSLLGCATEDDDELVATRMGKTRDRRSWSATSTPLATTGGPRLDARGRHCGRVRSLPDGARLRPAHPQRVRSLQHLDFGHCIGPGTLRASASRVTPTRSSAASVLRPTPRSSSAPA